MKRLLFIEEWGDISFWKHELTMISQKYDVIALSQHSKISDDLGCDSYYSYLNEYKPNFSIIYFAHFFLCKYCWREIWTIIHEKKKHPITCIVKSIKYYMEMCEMGKLLARDFDGFLEDTIVYTYWCDISTLFFAMNKDHYNIKALVTRMHGFDLYEDRREEGRQPFRWLINEKVDKIVVCGEKNRNYYLQEHISIDPSKICVNRLGCKGRINGPNNKCHENFARIVSCSSIIELKRVNLIVEAISRIIDYEIEWIHFGKNELGNCFSDFCEDKLSHRGNIKYRLAGYVPNDTIKEYFLNNYVDVFITTSSTEGAPVSIMEAMSAGIPIIGTDVGDISNMIANNGILLDANPSIESIKDAIVHIIGCTEEERNSMRKHSFDIWDNYYNAEKNTNELLEMLSAY